MGHRNRHRRALLGLGLGLLTGALPASVAGAHEDEPRIEVEVPVPERGAPVTVRGFDFPYDDVVTLTLVGDRGRTRLASVGADADGAFTHTVLLPTGLTAGGYVVEAADGHHIVDGPAFVVSTRPASLHADESRLDESDSLLAPMPTASAPPGRLPTDGTASAPAEAASGAGGTSVVIPALIVAIVGAAAVAVGARRRRSAMSTSVLPTRRSVRQRSPSASARSGQ